VEVSDHRTNIRTDGGWKIEDRLIGSKIVIQLKSVIDSQKRCSKCRLEKGKQRIDVLLNLFCIIIS